MSDKPRKMTVYLSGGISKNTNYIKDFKRAESKMNAARFEVINPVKVMGAVELPSHDDYMHIARAWVEVADSIFMICGWTKSEGAVEEYRHAKTLNKNILFEDGAERSCEE